jgi:hypothetical protein
MSKEYKVNRLLWETFEAILLAQGKRFVKDMAQTLLVDEKLLLRSVFPTRDAFKVSIQDSDATTATCMAFQPYSDAVIGRCRRPNQTGSAFCLHHQIRRPAVAPTPVTPIRKLQDAPDRPALWLLPDQTVIDSEGVVRGSLVSNRLMFICD